MKQVVLLVFSIILYCKGYGQTCADSLYAPNGFGLYPGGYFMRACNELSDDKTFIGKVRHLALSPSLDSQIVYFDAVKIDTVYYLPPGFELTTDVMSSATPDAPYGIWESPDPMNNVPSIGCISISASQSAWDSASTYSGIWSLTPGINTFALRLGYRVLSTDPDISFLYPPGVWTSESDPFLLSNGIDRLDTAINATICGDIWAYPEVTPDNFFSSACEGTVDVTGLNGTPPYSYQFSNGITNSTGQLDSLCVGVYTVEVTDANGYTATATFAIPADSSIYSNIAASQIWIPSDTSYAYAQTCDLDYTLPVDSFLLVDSVQITADTMIATWIVYQLGDTFTITGFYPFQGYGPSTLALVVFCMNGRSQPGVFAFFDFVNIGTGILPEEPRIVSQVFPNPSSGLFNLRLETTKWAAVRISDLSGRLIANRQFNGSTLYSFDLQDAPAGVYLMEIETEQGRTFKRLVRN